MATANSATQKNEKMQILPVHCVTAIFENPAPVPQAIADLKAAGFNESEIQVFEGEAGAKQVDAKPEQESTIKFLLQSVTKALADDAGYLERAAGKIRQGGAMIRVTVDDENEAAAERASQSLKARGGQQVQHWKEWTTEQL